jgi:hypothetical protein
MAGALTDTLLKKSSIYRKEFLTVKILRRDCFLSTTAYRQVGKVRQPSPRRSVSCLDLIVKFTPQGTQVQVAGTS